MDEISASEANDALPKDAEPLNLEGIDGVDTANEIPADQPMIEPSPNVTTEMDADKVPPPLTVDDRNIVKECQNESDNNFEPNMDVKDSQPEIIPTVEQTPPTLEQNGNDSNNCENEINNKSKDETTNHVNNEQEEHEKRIVVEDIVLRDQEIPLDEVTKDSESSYQPMEIIDEKSETQNVSDNLETLENDRISTQENSAPQIPPELSLEPDSNVQNTKIEENENQISDMESQSATSNPKSENRVTQIKQLNEEQNEQPAEQKPQVLNSDEPATNETQVDEQTLESMTEPHLKKCDPIDVQSTNETNTNSTDACLNDSQKPEEQDPEDLLVPIDYVPDASDVNTDESKRKYPSEIDDSSIEYKKFKLDIASSIEESDSMQTEEADVEADTNAVRNDDVSDQEMDMYDVLEKLCTESGTSKYDKVDKSPEKQSVELSETEADNVGMVDKAETSAGSDLNISDILISSEFIEPSEKTMALVDIIENADELMKREPIFEESAECLEKEIPTDKPTKSKKSKKAHKNDDDATVKRFKGGEELDFDISEKLKDMGEISLAPISKNERKAMPEYDLGDEISLEQICKKGSSNESDDKRSKITNLRKNIREVMDDNQLDASTLAAQREELERLARVQEQQRMIREMQRQVALDRQNSKTQNKVLSLLQGHTSLLKSSSSGSSGVASCSKIESMTSGDVEDIFLANKSGNLTPSVSIAPIKSQKKSESCESIAELSLLEPDNELSVHDMEDKLPKTDDLLEMEEEEEVQTDDDDVIELKPKKDIVTIDDSSDDDCILLSDEEDEEEDDSDPQNSGLHVNDAYNIPDDQGRVVINIGHPEGEEDIFLAPQIARIIKPHQIGGVRFLFDNIIESVERFSTSTGFGCILAHSMGLGKTLQLVCFCDIFLRHTNSKTILCIMPINTLQNWLAEFNMWLPEDPESTPLRAQGEVRPRNFRLFVLNDTHKTLNARSKIVLDWAREGGVLLIGYELYRLLSLKKVTKRRGRKTARDPEEEEREAEEHKKLLDEMHAALVKPGPDLVVCDEGHRIKNSHASISVALKQIRSKRRIVLTGYPLQNNLLEYWCMVDFVRPNYLGTKTEFSNMFERPIQNGQCIDSTPQDIKLMRYRAHVLHSLLLGFVQRRSHVVLQNSLPQKEEFVILVRMTSFQRQLYDVFMNDVVRTKAVPNPLKAFAVCCKIWNHPDVLYNFLKKREADLDLEEAEAAANDPTYEGNSGNTVATTAKSGRKRATTKKSKKAEKDEIKAVDAKPAASIPPNTINSKNKTANEPIKAELNDSSNSKTDDSTGCNKTEEKSLTPTNILDVPAPGVTETKKEPFQPYTSQSSGFTPSSQVQPQYNQMSYHGSQPTSGVYHPNYPYPALQPGFYNNYNQYDPNYYNSFGQPNSYNSAMSSMSNRYYYQQQQQSQQSSSAHGHPQSQQQQMQGRQGNLLPLNYYDYSGGNIATDPTKSSHSNDFNQATPWNSSHHNQQQYYSQHGEYQSSGSYSNYGNEYPPVSRFDSQQQNPTNNNNYPLTSLALNAQSNFPANSTNNNNNNNNNNQWSNSTASNSQINQNNQENNANTTGSSHLNYPSTNINQMNGPNNKMNPGTMDTNANDLQQNSINVDNQRNIVPNKDNASAKSDLMMKSEPLDEKNDTKSIDSPDKQSTDEQNDKKTIAIADIKEELIEKDLKVKDDGIPYDWAVELMKNYTPDLIANSAKMEIFFCILDETIRLGDRMLIFSQSLLTLNLIERFLQANPTDSTGTPIRWAKNTNYFRLDGSTGAQEREKLINEFNSNPNVHLFLVSTRAGSLGINLVGANRVVVFDASWNPCHDTQAVCRIFRYGQKKPCFVYRLVMDNCLEKKIYDRQVNKQGMSDRVIDECNPDARLSMKEVTNLCYDDDKETEICDFGASKDRYNDIVMKKVIEVFSKQMTKEPFQHESLLIDRKEKKLSMAEKRLAQRGYELEKQATSKPSYTIYNANRQQIGTYRATRPDGVIVTRPVASVRPIQADLNRSATARPTRWIPAEVWQRQGMTAQVLTLPGDVVIPTSSADKQNIILKEGQKVMVLKSPKGIYMQLESGKIIAIRTALKVGHNKDKSAQETPFMAREMQKRSITAGTTKSLSSPPSTTANSLIVTTNATVATTSTKTSIASAPLRSRSTTNHVQFGRTVSTNKNVQLGTAKPYNSKPNATPNPYPMSNSNSSFDADISDDSQFLEKLEEINKQQIEEENKQMMEKNKSNETIPKCVVDDTQTSNQSNEIDPLKNQMLSNPPQQNQQQQQIQHDTMQINSDKLSNGTTDNNNLMPNMSNEKSNSLPNTQVQNKNEPMANMYGGGNTNNASEDFSLTTNPNGPPYNMGHQNYNYYNSNHMAPNNNAHNQQQQLSQASQQPSNLHQPMMMAAQQQSENYPTTPQNLQQTQQSSQQQSYRAQQANSAQHSNQAYPMQQKQSNQMSHQAQMQQNQQYIHSKTNTQSHQATLQSMSQPNQSQQQSQHQRSSQQMYMEDKISSNIAAHQPPNMSQNVNQSNSQNFMGHHMQSQPPMSNAPKQNPITSQSQSQPNQSSHSSHSSQSSIPVQYNREPYNGKPPSHSQANMTVPHQPHLQQSNVQSPTLQQSQYQQQQYYSHNNYQSNNKSQSPAQPVSHMPNSSQAQNSHLPNTSMSSTNNYGQSQGSSVNFSNYPHSLSAASYQSQPNYEYNSPSSSSTMNYATPSPSQYSFASSSPSTSTLQAPSPDIRQQNMQHQSNIPSMDDDNNDSNRDYAMQQSQQYKMVTDQNKKQFNPNQQTNYSVDSVIGHYNNSNSGDNTSYPPEMKGSLKKYRHKQPIPSGKPQSAYGAGQHSDFKMDDQYGNFGMQTESTLSYLEKTASSIDENKSAFKASLSNITKPTPEMLGYGSQTMYGASSPQTPTKPKPKPRSRGRKPANKVENMKPDPIQIPSVPTMQMKQTEKHLSAPTPPAKDDFNDQMRGKSNALVGNQLPIGGLNPLAMNPTERNLPYLDLNTTYNHSDQTYQFSGYPSSVVPPPSPFALHAKSDSSMYSSHGNVQHPYTRSETPVSRSATVSSNNHLQGQSSTKTTSVNSMPTMSSELYQSQQTQPSIANLHHASQQSSMPASSGLSHHALPGTNQNTSLRMGSAFNSMANEPVKTTQHHTTIQHQTPPVSLHAPHAPQLDPLSSIYSHSQHYPSYMGYPPSFQSGLTSALPSYGSTQQSSLYGDAISSGGFTIPTTTVSSHSSSSAFHKPDEGTNSSYSSLSGSSGISSHSSHSSHSSLSSHGAPHSNQDSSSGYSSSSSFSVPSSTPQQQLPTQAKPVISSSPHQTSIQSYPLQSASSSLPLHTSSLATDPISSLLPPTTQPYSSQLTASAAQSLYSLPIPAAVQPYQHPYYTPAQPPAFPTAYQTPNPYAQPFIPPTLQPYGSSQYLPPPNWGSAATSQQQQQTQFRSYPTSAYGYPPSAWHP